MSRMGMGHHPRAQDRAKGLTKINKYYDVNFSAGAITTSGVFNGLGNLAQGVSPTTRLSSRIRIKRVDYRILLLASLQSTIATADIYNNLRVIMGRCVGPQSILSGTNFPTVGGFTDERQEFTVMLDRTVFLKNVSSGLAAPGSAFGPSPEGHWLIGSIDYPYEVLYDTTGGASDSFNVPYCYIVSDSNVTPSPTASAIFRITFEDIVR